MVNAQIIHIVLGGFKLAGHAHIHIVQDHKYAYVSDHGNFKERSSAWKVQGQRVGIPEQCNCIGCPGVSLSKCTSW